MKNFVLVAENLPVAPLLAALEAHPALWDDITTRQDYQGSAHHDTKAIFVRWCRGHDLYSAFNDLAAVPYVASSALWPSIAPLLVDVKARVDGIEMGRIIVTSLRAGGRIDPHADEGAYADHYERFHLVLQSEPGNEFTAGGETVWMRPGEAWWFNHKAEHRVVNGSGRDRVHLIVDMVAQEYRRERETEFRIMAGGGVG